MLKERVSRRPSPELPIVGQAIVSVGWLPVKFYFVSTIQFDGPNQRKLYSTNVYKCDRNGTILNHNEFYTRKSTRTWSKPAEDTREVLESLQRGKLPLRKQNF